MFGFTQCTVAEFMIPTTAAVAENDSTLVVCSVLATTPSSATLGMEVVVSLSTMDGTGKNMFLRHLLHSRFI